MNRIVLAPIALAFALAACNSGPSVSLTNATPEEVAKAVDKAGANQKMKPGQWELKLEVIDIEGPGITPDMQAAMKSQGSRTDSKCVTKEDVDKPMSEILAGAPSSQCRFAKYSIDGGKVASEMRCPGPGGEMIVKSDATYTDSSITAVAETDMTMPTGKAHSKMRISGKRTGECTTPPAPAKK
ncbi:DUF3617 domain-containing protein [Sphingomonas sp. AOB5]|uniref:DUF3617 domain-containing protein n=1 Tax=Sphingomonas sp. AOB5 TaxID=3034017 RepID=UPI0023F88513|nr:DUF3617 domain-containing protein [Sphingomonas sp. AOB5]MDF7776628.1 DUF3617 domain-containing protein [Sphingomonas sp. AOB5]